MWKRAVFSVYEKPSDKEKLFQHTKISISYCTKANVQQPFSNIACCCELAVHLLIFVKTSVLRQQYSHPFAPIQSLYAAVLRAKPVSAEAAGNFCEVTFDRALNRPRSPEVRKPLVYFWFFSYKRKARKTSLSQEVLRFCKPRNSTPKHQLPTATIKTFLRKLRGFPNLESAYKTTTSCNPIKAFSASRRLCPTFCKVQKVGQKP